MDNEKLVSNEDQGDQSLDGAGMETLVEIEQPWPLEGKTVKLANGFEPVAIGHVNVGTVTVFMPSEADQKIGFTPYKLVDETPVDATQIVLTEFFGRYIPFVTIGS